MQNARLVAHDGITTLRYFTHAAQWHDQIGDPSGNELIFPVPASLPKGTESGNRLLCVGCDAELYAHNRGDTHYFATKQGQKHASECTEHISNRDAPPYLRLSRALENKHPIILDLKIDALGMGKPFPKQSKKPDNTVIIPVQTADELWMFQNRIHIYPGRYIKGNPKIADHVMWHNRIIDPKEMMVDINDAVSVRKMILAMMERTSKPSSKDGCTTDIYLPYFFTLSLNQELMGYRDRSPQQFTNNPVMVQTAQYQIPIKSRQFKPFPYQYIRFVVDSHRPETTELCRASIQTMRPLYVMAQINETAIRSRVFSSLGRGTGDGNVLEIPINVTHLSQIVPFSSYHHT